MTDLPWSSTPIPPITMTPASERLSRLRRHLTLWVVQIWLAMFFVGAGYTKMTQSHELLTLLMTWPGFLGLAHVQWIGGLEIALGVAVVSPLLSWRVFGPVMSISAVVLLAATGGMTGYHLIERDLLLGAVNLVLAAMSLFVVLGRRGRVEALPLLPMTR